MPRKRNIIKTKKTVKRDDFGTRKFLLLLIVLVGLIVLGFRLSRIDDADLERFTAVEPEVPAVLEVKDMTSREQISYFAEEYGVLARLLRFTNRNDFIEVSMPVNYATVDLDYTNFRLTSFLTSHNWQQVSGVETTDRRQQLLTYVAPDNQRYRFRVSYDRTGAYPTVKPQLAIVVKGFGAMKDDEIERWLELDKRLCYSVLPINRTSTRNVELILSADFEALLEIPMEAIGYPIVPTPEYAIFAHLKENEIVSRLESYFRLVPNVSGSITHLGSLITTDRAIMSIILKYVKEKNLYFIDDKDIRTSIAFEIAQQMLIPSFEKTITFEPNTFRNDTDNRLLINRLNDLNRSKIIVTLQQADDRTYDFVKTLLRVAMDNGYEVVRMSEM